jgi:hypothetical protein
MAGFIKALRGCDGTGLGRDHAARAACDAFLEVATGRPSQGREFDVQIAAWRAVVDAVQANAPCLSTCIHCGEPVDAPRGGKPDSPEETK